MMAIYSSPSRGNTLYSAVGQLDMHSEGHLQWAVQTYRAIPLHPGDGLEGLTFKVLSQLVPLLEACPGWQEPRHLPKGWHAQSEEERTVALDEKVRGRVPDWDFYGWKFLESTFMELQRVLAEWAVQVNN